MEENNKSLNCDEKLLAGASGCKTYTNERFEKDNEHLLAPTAPEITYEQEPQMMVLPEFTGLSNEAIKNACYEYVDNKCCYSNGALKDMVFQNITSTCSLHYKLETYTEKRWTESKKEPYYGLGQSIDGRENGPKPGLWDISLSPFSMFQNGQRRVKIPHSDEVKSCYNCGGFKLVRCSSCGGMGRNRCLSCNARGRRLDGITCSGCSGSGSSPCFSCSSKGKVTCFSCNGCGRFKHSDELVVEWKNNVDEFVANPKKIPIKLLKKALGKDIFKEEKPEVSPITNSLDVTINQQSLNLIKKRKTEKSRGVIRQQRQTIRAIPVTMVDYTWRGNVGKLYVYGYESKVYFENYPQKYCCCVCF